MIPIGTNLEQNRLPLVTIIIVALNVVAFFFEIVLPEPLTGALIYFFGYGTHNWWNPVALVSHMFLHGDIYHISFNMLFLWTFGAPLEDRLGRARYALYYLATGAISGIVSTAMNALAHPGELSYGIGASGAISGVMGLYLYRCYYSKVKLVIAPLLLPRQINIPVIPLVLLWFFQDVILGILSLSVRSGIGHWAHVSGMLAGIVIGKVKGFGQEGRIENLRTKIMAKLEGGGGWSAAELELLKLAGLAPDDPDVNLDLARLYVHNSNKRSARKYFLRAVQTQLAKDPVEAGYIINEVIQSLGEPLSLQSHLKSAEALIDSGDYQTALDILGPATSDKDAAPALAEKARALHIRLLRHLGDTETAFGAVGEFMQDYPSSRYSREIKAALLARPGEVIRPSAASLARSSHTEHAAASDKTEAEVLSWIQLGQRFFTDPVFWSLLLFLNISLPFLFPKIYFSPLSPVYIFIIAYVMTILQRSGIEGWLMYFGKSQKQADREFETNKALNIAKQAEWSRDFAKAAEIYEGLLSSDPNHHDARFNLARVYEKNLGDLAAAARHYGVLSKSMPEGHPYRIEASTFLQRRPAAQT